MTTAQAIAVAPESQVPAASFNFNQAIEDNLPMARKMAKNAYYKWGCNFDQEDLEGYANLGLVTAARKFDIRQAVDGKTFATFAKMYIHWAIKIGRNQMAVIHAKQYKAVLAGKMSKPKFVHEGEDYCLADALFSKEEDPFEAAAFKEEVEARLASLSELTAETESKLSALHKHSPDQAKVMRYRLEGKTAPQIAALIGRSTTATNSIIYRAEASMRRLSRPSV
jgi:RNA polymerase sigma factor (sigma-70 family)